jgi:putative membrane protein
LINRFTKYQIATGLAILFHTIGLVGILFFKTSFFVQATAFNLLLMFALLLWTQQDKNIFFYVFMLAVFCIGMSVEIIGVNTGALFGDYKYGGVLGLSFRNVPLIIGINWFVIIFCSGISIHTLLMKAIGRVALDTGKKPQALKALSVIIDGATLAVFFDWIMEPVAIKLGYWHWGVDGEVPMYNYLSWFTISMILLAFFHFSPFGKQNKFAVHLLLIQLMFFLLLNSFLP